MSLNGISNVTDNNSTNAYASTSTTSAKSSSGKSSAYGNDAAAVYKPSTESKKAKRNLALVAKLKADQSNRLNQMQNLVKEMFQKQGKTYTNSDKMWKMLAAGDFTVDPQTAQAAKDEISEDGYWGVNQTSDRIFDFAKALSGGDEDKMNDMLKAFKKGFDQATKSWGRTLPDISQSTYDAVLKKFEDYKNSSDSDA